MEEEIIQEQPEQRPERPAWQVWCARIAVVVMLAGFLLYCWQIAHGGL